jgi:hypothetical protein
MPGRRGAVLGLRLHPNDAPSRLIGRFARQAATTRRRELQRTAVMQTYKGTITPNRRHLTDPRSSAPRPRDPKAPLLNDRRSTR